MTTQDSQIFITAAPARARLHPGLLAGIVVLLLLALLAGGVYVLLPHDRRVLPGITAAGVALGGMTRADARAALEAHWQSADGRLAIAAGGETRVATYDELGIYPDLDATLHAAMALGRLGSLPERLRDAWRARQQGIALQPVIRLDEARAKAVFAAFAATINREAVNAAMRFDPDSGSIVEVPEQPGATLDVPAAVALLRAQVLPALNSDAAVPATLALPYHETAPEVTAADLATVDTVLGTYTTSFTTSTAARAHNVTTAARALDGEVIMPHKVFSFNDTVGPRDADSGFKIAPVIINGQLRPGMGGGICQVSTTLYNAVLLANLDIVMRSHHSLPSHYVPLGMDATVAYGAIDFRFRNDTDTPVVLQTRIRNRRLTVWVLGQGPAPVVRIERTGYRALPLRVVTKTDPTLPPGKKVVDEPGKPGGVITVIRVVGDGPDAVRQTLSTDRYLGEAKVVRTGPAAAAVVKPATGE
jgi:vancomycin resistance protein YoaR